MLRTVPNVTHMSLRQRRRESVRMTLVRVTCLAVAAASLAGLLMSAPPAPAALAAGSTGSAVTVSWAEATGAAAAFQPPRVAADAAYAGFKNLAVTVDQTADVGDQAVRVSVTGFAKTVSVRQQDGTTYSDAMNFIQAMQCWGPDPLAADFARTCQWGGRYVANNGLGNSVYPDNVLRVAAKDAAPDVVEATDVPFLLADSTNNTTSDNTSITGRQIGLADAAAGLVVPRVGRAPGNEHEPAAQVVL